jgi:hypothetical protein
MLYLERGEYQQGETVLGDIPSQYGLEAGQLTNHQNMEAYYCLVRGIFESGNSLMDAGATDIQQLQTIRDSEAGRQAPGPGMF